MDDTHPIYQRPIIHCAKCHHPLVFPRKKETDAEDIQNGVAVLAECVPCAVAVQVPASMFQPSAHTHVDTTVARPWPIPRAVLTDEQKNMLGH
jgi:RNase P subunit RPR2